MPAPAVAAVLVALLLPLSALAAPAPPAGPSHSHPVCEYEPYVAFPHPEPRRGRAFLPASPDTQVHPLLADIRLPDNPTNPAPRPALAYDRHPLYTPGRHANFSTTEFRFNPGRLDKRDVVSSVDVPFPPSACASPRAPLPRPSMR